MSATKYLLCIILNTITIGLLLFTTTTAQANPDNSNHCCVCVHDSGPWWQLPFFKHGCEIWLNEQTSCSLKLTFSQNHRNHREWAPPTLPSQCHQAQISKGFVGHWSNWHLTYYYIGKVLIPLIEQTQSHLTWHNTGCKALDNPVELARAYGYRKKKAEADAKWFNRPLSFVYQSNFIIRGYQADTVGLWDRITLPSSLNFWALVDLNQGEIHLPPCSAYENKVCSYGIQAYQQASCIDPNGKVRSLSCCTVTDTAFDELNIEYVYWSDSRSCYPKR